MSQDTPSLHLVSYDYGQGGLWGVMVAPSLDEIKSVYPEFTVVDGRPTWMSLEDFAELARAPYNLYEPPGDFSKHWSRPEPAVGTGRWRDA